MKPIDPLACAEFIQANARAYAQAKADRMHLEKFLGSKKALLMQASDKATSAAKEMDALAHPEYIALLDGLKVAVYQEEALKSLIGAAEIKVEIWRSTEASARALGRAVT
jgi:hypothetical protein